MIGADRFSILIITPSGGTFRCTVRAWLLTVLSVVICIFFILGCIWAVAAWQSRWGAAAASPAASGTMTSPADTAIIGATSEFSEVSPLPQTRSPYADQRGTPGKAVKGVMLKIVNPAFRVVHSRELKLMLEMHAFNTQGKLTGRVVFSLVTAKGGTYPLVHQDTVFEMIRFKKLALSATLPVGTIDMTDAMVLVEVLVRGDVVLRQTFPIIR